MLTQGETYAELPDVVIMNCKTAMHTDSPMHKVKYDNLQIHL